MLQFFRSFFAKTRKQTVHLFVVEMTGIWGDTFFRGPFAKLSWFVVELILELRIDSGVSKNRGTGVPQNGWFISWKTLWTNGWFRGFSHYFWFNNHLLWFLLIWSPFFARNKTQISIGLLDQWKNTCIPRPVMFAEICRARRCCKTSKSKTTGIWDFMAMKEMWAPGAWAIGYKGRVGSGGRKKNNQHFFVGEMNKNHTRISKKPRPFRHLFVADRILRAWYRGIKNAGSRKRAQGRAQDIPYHHTIYWVCRLVVECWLFVFLPRKSTI